MRQAVLLPLLLGLSFACPASGAPPAATLASVTKQARSRLVHLGAGPTMDPIITRHAVTSDSDLPSNARVVLVAAGKPLERGELRKAAWAIVEWLEDQTGDKYQSVYVQFYADGRLRGASLENHPAKASNWWDFDGDDSRRRGGQGPRRYVMHPDAIDTTRPVNWYACAHWWKPFRLDGGKVTALEGWQFDAWYAAGNATPRPAEGSTDHAPEKVR